MVHYFCKRSERARARTEMLISSRKLTSLHSRRLEISIPTREITKSPFVYFYLVHFGVHRQPRCIGVLIAGSAKLWRLGVEDEMIFWVSRASSSLFLTRPRELFSRSGRALRLDELAFFIFFPHQVVHHLFFHLFNATKKTSNANPYVIYMKVYPLAVES